MKTEGISIERKPEINKEYIKKLESSTKISPKDKFFIITTYLGLRPCSEIQSVLIKSSRQEEIGAEIKDILNGLGLSFTEGWVYLQGDEVDTNYLNLLYTISGQQELLNKTQDAKRHDVSDMERYHREYGLSLGYPLSAVEGFVDREPLDDTGRWPSLFIYPPEITEEDKKFKFFALSKKGWREEIEWLRELVRKTKEISPEIYKQVMQEKEGPKILPLPE